ncbi:MAG: hypothetical protein ACREDR_10585 [Blastocatellia bacterium]
MIAVGETHGNANAKTPTMEGSQVMREDDLANHGHELHRVAEESAKSSTMSAAYGIERSVCRLDPFKVGWGFGDFRGLHPRL